jgi:hypothetical protein
MIFSSVPTTDPEAENRSLFIWSAATGAPPSQTAGENHDKPASNRDNTVAHPWHCGGDTMYHCGYIEMIRGSNHGDTGNTTIYGTEIYKWAKTSRITLEHREIFTAIYSGMNRDSGLKAKWAQIA